MSARTGATPYGSTCGRACGRGEQRGALRGVTHAHLATPLTAVHAYQNTPGRCAHAEMTQAGYPVASHSKRLNKTLPRSRSDMKDSRSRSRTDPLPSTTRGTPRAASNRGLREAKIHLTATKTTGAQTSGAATRTERQPNLAEGTHTAPGSGEGDCLLFFRIRSDSAAQVLASAVRAVDGRHSDAHQNAEQVSSPHVCCEQLMVAPAQGYPGRAADVYSADCELSDPAPDVAGTARLTSVPCVNRSPKRSQLSRGARNGKEESESASLHYSLGSAARLYESLAWIDDVDVGVSEPASLCRTHAVADFTELSAYCSSS